jgi:hypothetical protein
LIVFSKQFSGGALIKNQILSKGTISFRKKEIEEDSRKWSGAKWIKSHI